MTKDEEVFSYEYVSDGGTEPTQQETSDALDKKNETEATLEKYGLSKPRRYTIRGKIIHD